MKSWRIAMSRAKSTVYQNFRQVQCGTQQENLAAYLENRKIGSQRQTDAILVTDLPVSLSIFREASDPYWKFVTLNIKKGYGRNYSRSIGTLCLLQNREGHIRRIQQKQLPS